MPPRKSSGRSQPEHDHRVGGGRLGAAAAVGDRARVGARRARADAEDAARIDVGDGAAAGADRVDVDHRDHRLVRPDLRVEQVLHAQLAFLREADVGRGPAHVERDHVLLARLPAGPDAAHHAGDRAGHEQVDRLDHGALGRRDARGGGHQVDARLDVHRAQRGVEAADVARDLGADVGVQADGGEALVLAVLRDDLARDGDERLGELLAHDRRDALLVHRVEEREEQADGDGLDLLGLEAANLRAHLVVIERDEDRAVLVDALVDRQPEAPPHDRLRLPRQVLPEREVHRLLVARDVQDVAVALGRDHPDLGAVVLDHDVRRDGGAMEDLVELLGLDPGHRAQLADALDGADGGVCGRRGGLVDDHRARVVVDVDEVGERAADVDSDSTHSISLWSGGEWPVQAAQARRAHRSGRVTVYRPPGRAGQHPSGIGRTFRGGGHRLARRIASRSLSPTSQGAHTSRRCCLSAPATSSGRSASP